MQMANNVLRIPSKTSDAFFKYWVMFLKPFHKLTDREIDIVACFLKHRHELSKVIKDPDILDRVTLEEVTRKKVMQECNITLSYFTVLLSKLRKRQIIVDGRINPRFIPNIREDEKNFQLLLLFNNFDYKDGIQADNKEGS